MKGENECFGCPAAGATHRRVRSDRRDLCGGVPFVYAMRGHFFLSLTMRTEARILLWGWSTTVSSTATCCGFACFLVFFSFVNFLMVLGACRCIAPWCCRFFSFDRVPCVALFDARQTFVWVLYYMYGCMYAAASHTAVVPRVHIDRKYTESLCCQMSTGP